MAPEERAVDRPEGVATRRRRWPVVALPILAVVVAVAVGVATLGAEPDRAGGRDGGSSAVTTTPPDAVAVTSDAIRVGTLDELLDTADLVVRGEVVATERGRWFGDGTGGPRIQSRLVTLRVGEVLAGVAPAAPSLLVEEEGWTEDGAPLVVDGLAPSREGDVGTWFLLDGGDPELGAYVVVSAQGRYLEDGDGTLRGADLDDDLVADLAGRTPDELAEAVRAADRGRTGPPP